MHFTSEELDYLQDTAEAYMMDECNIITTSGTVDSYGDYIESTVTTSGIECGVEETNGTERYGGVTIADLDAVIRLPISTTIAEKDRIQVDERLGATVSKTYEVLAIKRGPTCLRVLGKELTYA